MQQKQIPISLLPMRMLFVLMGLMGTSTMFAQKIDSIFFNLYTDSLKKGSWNYINVDARLSNGKFIPLSSQELILSSSAGKVEGSSIWIDWDFKQEQVTVEVKLRRQPAVFKTTTIWVKKQDLQLLAPVTDTLLQQINDKRKKTASSKKKKKGVM